MSLCDETIIFLAFVGIGFVFSIIFDFFRAIRKLKKVKNRAVYIQDILYFITIGILLLIAVLNIQKDVFRLYLIVAIILGIMIYISVIGNKVMKLFLSILKASNAVKKFILLPIKVYLTIFDKQLRKIKKYVIYCCKKISYMIEFYHKKIKIVASKRKKKLKTKERRGIYDKSRKANC